MAVQIEADVFPGVLVGLEVFVDASDSYARQCEIERLARGAILRAGAVLLRRHACDRATVGGLPHPERRPALLRLFLQTEKRPTARPREGEEPQNRTRH
jgi:hypothetical protein